MTPLDELTVETPLDADQQQEVIRRYCGELEHPIAESSWGERSKSLHGKVD